MDSRIQTQIRKMKRDGPDIKHTLEVMRNDGPGIKHKLEVMTRGGPNGNRVEWVKMGWLVYETRLLGELMDRPDANLHLRGDGNTEQKGVNKS